MDILKHFDHHGRKQNIEHFTNLIHVALADGIIDQSETEMLQKFGRKLGFTETEVENLINSEKNSVFHPPYDYFKRFEQVYEVVKIILADDQIAENELLLARRFAIKSGFSEAEIPFLIEFLIKGINESADEEELFESYKKKRKT